MEVWALFFLLYFRMAAMTRRRSFSSSRPPSSRTRQSGRIGLSCPSSLLQTPTPPSPPISHASGQIRSSCLCTTSWASYFSACISFFLQLIVKSPLPWCYAVNSHEYSTTELPAFRWFFYSQDLIESWCLPEDAGIVIALLSDGMLHSLGTNNRDHCWCWIIPMLVTRNLVHILFWNAFTLCLM